MRRPSRPGCPSFQTLALQARRAGRWPPRRALLFAGLACVLGLQAPAPALAETVRGSGTVREDTRPLPAFRRVDSAATLDLVLTAGDREQVVVSGDDNIVPLVTTEVVDGLLLLRLKAPVSVQPRSPLRATVQFKALDGLVLKGAGNAVVDRVRSGTFELTVAGSGNATVERLEADVVAVLIQGSGNVKLAGEAARQGFVVKGAGNVEARQLVGRQVAVKVQGVGNAHVNARETLDAEVSGVGNVYYTGDPQVQRSVRGIGRIIGER